jgi:hypothetical protein
MAHSYTPGLRVTEQTVLRRERRLPLKGEVLVERGQAVRATDVVARTRLPGNVQTVNVANALGIDPSEVPRTLLKKAGDSIAAGETIAEKKSFFGLMSSKCDSPVAGTLESCSEITGQVIVREPPMPIEIDAYVEGRVAEVLPGEGVIVETKAAFVQGIFGVGGETFGEIAIAVEDPKTELAAERLHPEHKGKVVVGGAYVSYTALRRAIEFGVHAVIVGGFDDRDLRELLGYDLGVAITGTEQLGITLVLTEGFGRMPMAERTFRLLAKHAGRFASVSGATQIRAGVMRPEIVIALDQEQTKIDGDHRSLGLEVSSLIRGIREPYFGRIGTVTALPSELRALETEAHVRVLEAEFDGQRVVVPRANVELIES